MKNFLLLAVAITVLLFQSCSKPGAKSKVDDPNTVQTRIGELKFSHEFENGYPTDETVEKLYDEIDFQRACQAYLWGLPLVSMHQWYNQQNTIFNAEDGEFVIYTSYKDKQGILTANLTTPYVFSFVDLTKSGPMVLELKPGINASGIATFWQYTVTDVGTLGPDQNKGGKYLILPPNSELPDVEGYFMVRMPSNHAWFGFRALVPDKTKGIEWIQSLKLYPYTERNNPPESKIINAGSKEWSHVQPRGIEYWKSLASAINSEIVRPQDRMMMATLKFLGIEKGRDFNPTDKQRKILEEASIVGEAMAKANTFEKRFDDVYYRKETHWKYVMVWNPMHATEFYHQLDEMAAYTYEAVATSRAMATKIPGKGQAYLGAYKDNEGKWLDGSLNYKLHIPPNVPAARFWSITVYDVDTRCPIDNEQQIADKSSRMDLITNEDGSVDLFFGPEVPEGKEKNWVPTTPNQGFFAYLRLYGPKEPYFDRTWVLPDFVKSE